jgi:hypothetical protein
MNLDSETDHSVRVAVDYAYPVFWNPCLLMTACWLLYGLLLITRRSWGNFRPGWRFLSLVALVYDGSCYIVPRTYCYRDSAACSVHCNWLMIFPLRRRRWGTLLRHVK